MVSKDFKSTHALNGLSDGPVWRVNGIKYSWIYEKEPRIAPASTRPCPSICLVAEYITTSAPSASGFCRTGDAITLSTITVAPTLCARSLTIRISTISISGLLGDSIKTTLVGLFSAAAQMAESFPFTSSTVTPHFGRISVNTTWQELNMAADATT